MVTPENISQIQTKTGMNICYFSESLSIEEYIKIHDVRPKGTFLMVGRVDM